MRLAMVLIPQVGNIWNAPVIYNTALLYIFFNFLKDWYKDALLKYQSWNSYNVMGRIHTLHSSHLEITPTWIF